jgi:hypothetical protein
MEKKRVLKGVNMKMKTIHLICILITAVLLSSVIFAYAVTTWQKTFNLIYIEPDNPSFQVYTDAAHTNIWSPGIEDLTGSGAQLIVFYIVNDGNVPITVGVVNEVMSDASNTATWDTLTLPLLVGDSSSLELTLVIAVAGTYSFNFDMV